MVVWNDLDVDEKVKVYDKGVDITSDRVSMSCWSVTVREICGRPGRPDRGR